MRLPGTRPVCLVLFAVRTSYTRRETFAYCRHRSVCQPYLYYHQQQAHPLHTAAVTGGGTFGFLKYLSGVILVHSFFPGTSTRPHSVFRSVTPPPSHHFCPGGFSRRRRTKAETTFWARRSCQDHKHLLRAAATVAVAVVVAAAGARLPPSPKGLTCWRRGDPKRQRRSHLPARAVAARRRRPSPRRSRC